MAFDISEEIVGTSLGKYTFEKSPALPARADCPAAKLPVKYVHVKLPTIKKSREGTPASASPATEPKIMV